MDDSLDDVFAALGSPVRRKILDILKKHPGCSVNQVSSFFEMSRIGVMKHLRLLVSAGLVISKKEGRRRMLFLNSVPIQMIYDRWTSEYSALWGSRLTRLKYTVESGGKQRGRK